MQYIADDYLGLDAVFTNIIGLMNLAELGIGSAIAYALYQPLSRRDERMVRGIMQLFQRAYRAIAIFMMVVGVALMPFLTVIAPEAQGLSHVHLLFGLYLANTVAGYLFTYKGTLANADQRSYLVTRNHYVFIISLNLAQIFVIYHWRSFFAYAAIQSLFTIAEGIALACLMDHKYPLLKAKERVELPREMTSQMWSNVRKIVVGKIGNTVISSTDNLILSNVVGLSQTGVYSNYALIKSSLQAIVCQFQAAVTASIGNIAALGEREKELDYFWYLNFIITSLYTVTSVCLYNLMQPFIAYWLGGSYLMDRSVLVLTVAIYYFSGVRGIFGTFSSAHGIFDLDAKKTVAEAFANLVISIVLAMRWGIEGVLMGTVISSVLVGLPFELINVGRALPEISKRRYVREFILYTFTSGVTLLLSIWVCSFISMRWYIRLTLGALVSTVVFVLVWCVVYGRSRYFKRTLELASGILRDRFHNLK